MRLLSERRPQRFRIVGEVGYDLALAAFPEVSKAKLPGRQERDEPPPAASTVHVM